MIFNKSEEIANTLSHAIGILCGLWLLPSILKGPPSYIYAFGFIFLFVSSTAYHAVTDYNLKRQLQKVDHISIYFMIAGSYTPFIFLCLDGVRAWLFLGVMWTIVLLGTIFKLFFTGRFDKWSLALYLGMGWMLVLIIKPFLNSFDYYTIGLVVLGGLFYTVGVYFYAHDNRKYFHLIWHLFVLGGALSHFFAISNIIK
ncbi:PAQR family membrane homeostasis protein TrhA [Portibacter marinus]|uniref:PAQR family membrane homeostasis protein TrhA n=1 Tax=Portibacter marinus TaxID=2898660 RepID=UPI001F35F5AF|nr:hemolysin III family protein [Portibacter marinus]